MSLDLGHLLDHLTDFPAYLQFLFSAVGSALTEELATVVVFGLARAGRLSWFVAVSSVFFGTVGMNMALWWAGRIAGVNALRWKMFAKIQGEKLDKLRHHVQREGWIAVAVARFVPGTRVAIFVLSGILGMTFPVFFVTQVVSSVLWIVAAMGLIHIVIELAKSNPWGLGLGVVAIGLGIAAILRWRQSRKRTT